MHKLWNALMHAVHHYFHYSIHANERDQQVRTRLLKRYFAP